MGSTLVFWIDSASNRLAGGWNSFVFASKPSFKQGDAIDVLLRWIKRPTSSNSFMEENPWGSSDISFEVGNVSWKPRGGKWYLNYDEYSTQLLDYDASAEDVQLALNSIIPIVEQGGVSVTQLSEDGYKIVFEENGTRTSLSGYGEPLVPNSNVIVEAVTLGSSTTKAVFWVTLRQTIVTEEVGNWVDEAACTADVEEINPSTWDIYLTSDPQDGMFSFILDNGEPDSGVPIEISVFDTQSTVQELVGEDFTVQKQGDFRWRIWSVSGETFEASIDNDSKLVSFKGKRNTILFDRQLISEMLEGSASTTSTLEISVTESGNKQTLLSIPCTITGKVTS